MKKLDKMTSEEYFKLYREKLKDLENIRMTAAKYKKKLSELREESDSLSIEISKMKILMTIMIDEGLDPAEAILRHNSDELAHIHRNFWSDKSNFEFKIDDTSIDAIYTISPITIFKDNQ